MKIVILNKEEEQYIRDCIINDYEIIRKKVKRNITEKIFKKFNIKEDLKIEKDK